MAKSKLQYHVHVEDEHGEVHVFGPEDDVPGWARKKITNRSAWADTADADADGDGDADDPDEEVKPYAKWLKADLEAEVTARNEGREDDALIVVGGTGKVADLAAALDADDVKQADTA
jgi:hypothetical protein